MAGFCRALAATAALLLLGVADGLAARYDPAFRFRTIATPHFRIHYHQGEQAQARRLAIVAERVHDDLTRRLASRPSGLTHVVLADQQDAANGWATPIPFNTIEITAAWPGASSSIGNTSDWLEMVFAHEYAHILQLDRSSGFARPLRRLFGRTALAMPNLSLPAWQIEGLATMVETRATGRGRIVDGQFATIVDLPLSAGNAPGLDRLGGGLVAWPAGDAAYAFGGYFHEYLTRRFGEAKIAEVYRRTSGRLHFFSAGAIAAVLGEPVGRLWSDFLASREATRPTATPDSTPVRRLTRHGFSAWAPRIVDAPGGLPAGGKAEPGPMVAYAIQDPHAFPGLMVLPLAGDLPPRRLADASGARGIAAVDGGRFLLFDRLDWRKNVATEGDLYARERAGGLRRLTSGMRLAEPDVSPDGRLVAASHIVDGARRVVIHHLSRDTSGWPVVAPKPTMELGHAEAQYGWPRFSPDGRLLAMERQWIEGPAELVLLDLESGALTTVVSSPDSRNVTPAWMPDGRSLLFASDRGGGTFGLFAVDVARGPDGRVEPGGLFSVCRPQGGARAPAVTPDGRTVVFVGATADGDDLFSASSDRRSWRPASALPVAASDGEAVRGETPPRVADATSMPPDASYRPVSTLGPTSWTPLATVSDRRIRVGADVGGADVLGYHAWRASALWAVGGPSLAGARRTRPTDWRLVYAYSRWTPGLYAAVRRESSLVRVADAGGHLSDLERREDSAAFGVMLPRLRVHWRQTWRAELNFRELPADALRVGAPRANSLRASWVLSTAHQYGYSISPEQGAIAAVTSEHIRPALGASGSGDALTGEMRLYLPAWPRHAVVAARLAAGRSWGQAAVRRDFLIGGASAASSLGGFGAEGLNLLRGSSIVWQRGSKALVGNLDLRWPIARIERGVGSVPLFLRSVHAALFVDGAEGWTGRFDRHRLLGSAGAEVSADLWVGFAVPLTITAGVARTRTPSAGAPLTGHAFFARIGRAF